MSEKTATVLPGSKLLPPGISDVVNQPAIRKALPAFVGIAGLGLAALAWSVVSEPPQRTLFSALNDADRAAVAAALDSAAIDYSIDPGTGSLTVGEDDYHRARMFVASNGALATPETGTDLINSLPMGASRTLEGDRLRVAKERELTLTIKEIDGVQAVRVHLGQAEKSVFVREKLPPSASVMVRMAPGRSLSNDQVRAIANLVSGSIPGMPNDAVRIVDQHGRLLTGAESSDHDSLELQSRMEEKIRLQLAQLLTPMFGAGNFSFEAQVELDMAEVTAAREQYDPQGALVSETEQRRQSALANARGVPGATSNMPPENAATVDGPPIANEGVVDQELIGDRSSSRQYQVGREVSVSNSAPGAIDRLSVAVALDQNALEGFSEEDLQKLETLISAAVGANPERGDQVAVMVRPFDQPVEEELAVWERSWFSSALRTGAALLAVLLTILLVIRPAMKMIGKRTSEPDGADAPSKPALLANADNSTAPRAASNESHEVAQGGSRLNEQIDLAQRLARERPEDALVALRRMLVSPPTQQGSQ
nr:flagellar basal-body MS-ring/collar protein FliF [Sphingomicrobium astaxanthinifaciens]